MHTPETQKPTNSNKAKILSETEKQQIRDLYAKKIEQKSEQPNEHYSVTFEINNSENLELAKTKMHDHLANNLHLIADSMYDPLEHYEFLRVAERGNKVEYEVIVKGVKVEMEWEEVEGYEGDTGQYTFLDYLYKTINNEGANIQNISVNPI
jgi:hypothetical protein